MATGIAIPLLYEGLITKDVSSAESVAVVRPLTHTEWRLADWMLQHSGPKAQAYLAQLQDAEAIP